MINNPIIFYSAFTLIVIFSLLSLVAKNVIYSLLSAVMVFFLGALLFYILGAEYNAIVQVAVYGLAVPIIIGISVMFGIGKEEKRENKNFIGYLVFLCAGIFILAFKYLVMMSLVINPNTFKLAEPIMFNSYDSIQAVARGLFVNYVWAFELVSLILTIVIVGLGIISRQSKRRRNRR